MARMFRCEPVILRRFDAEVFCLGEGGRVPLVYLYYVIKSEFFNFNMFDDSHIRV